MARYDNRPQGNYGNDMFGLKAAGDDENASRRNYRGTNDKFYVRRGDVPLFAPLKRGLYEDGKNRKRNYKRSGS